MNNRDRNIFVALTVLALTLAVGAGLAIRPSGIHDPADQPTAPRTPAYTVDTMPIPEPDLLSTQAEAATAGCANPGNPKGYCWYSGYRWPSRWVCIDSSIPGHPLGAVATLFRSIDSRLKVSAYHGAGQCKAHGFPSNRRVSFVPFTAADKRARPYGCGLMFAPNYGAYGAHATMPLIKINVTGYQRTPCGGGLEWRDVFAHEFAHSYGLSHNQPRSTSIMRQGHVLDAYDKYYIKMISGLYPTVTRAQIP